MDRQKRDKRQQELRRNAHFIGGTTLGNITCRVRFRKCFSPAQNEREK